MNTARALTACLLCLSLTGHALAQSSPALDDPIIIEDDGEAPNGAGKEGRARPYNLSENFAGELVGSYSGLLSETSRYNAGLKLTYRNEWERQGLSLTLTGHAYASGVSLELDREDNTAGTKTSITREIDTSQFELREGYVRFNQGFLDIYVGRRVMALGQFDAFSPVDFVLPIDLSDSSIDFTKLENKYPQTTASLYLNLGQKLELQAHYFPQIERDPVTVDLLEASVRYLDQDNMAQVADFNSPDDESQYIGRIVYTGENYIAGLTYYKGYALYSENQPGFITDDDGDPIIGRRKPDPSYPSLTGYGFELAVPYERFTFKYEVLLTEQYESFSHCPPEAEQCQEYHNLLNSTFSGRAWASGDILIHALGFDYNSDRWTLNVAIFQLIELYDDDIENALARGEEVSGDSRESSEGVFPGINVARHYGRNQDHTTGLGLGLFGNIAGAILYQGYQASDNLQLGISLEVLTYQSDNQSEDLIEEEENNTSGNFITVDQTDTLIPSIRFSLLYSF